MADQAQGLDFSTVIGGDVRIRGEVSVEKGLRIDGVVEGSVVTRGKILVGKSGQLKAEVKAGFLVVEGKVTGNVTVSDRVQIEPSGHVYGDLTAGKLVVAEGATIVGKLNVGPSAGKAEVEEAVLETIETGALRIGSSTAQIGGLEKDRSVVRPAMEKEVLELAAGRR